MLSSPQRSHNLVAVVAVFAVAMGTPVATPRQMGAQAAQIATVSEAIAAGDRESKAHRGVRALEYYEQAIALDSNSAVARWKAAGELVDLGENEKDSKTRRSLYDRATVHARRATVLAPREADAWFHLSRAIGRTALNVGPRDRVKFAGEVRTYAMKALELDPKHAGALHVLGVWHAEVMRLNSFARAMAKAFLGGQVLGTASWAEAARLLEQAVVVQPNRTVHRLDLARIYRDMGRKADARREYEAAIAAPMMDANDAAYKRSAAEELRALK